MIGEGYLLSRELYFPFPFSISIMRKARWLAPWKDSFDRPVIYHCVTRVVDRKFAFGKEEKEQFRIYMRMSGNF